MIAIREDEDWRCKEPLCTLSFRTNYVHIVHTQTYDESSRKQRLKSALFHLVIFLLKIYYF